MTEQIQRNTFIVMETVAKMSVISTAEKGALPVAEISCSERLLNPITVW